MNFKLKRHLKEDYELTINPSDAFCSNRKHMD